MKPDGGGKKHFMSKHVPSLTNTNTNRGQWRMFSGFLWVNRKVITSYLHKKLLMTPNLQMAKKLKVSCKHFSSQNTCSQRYNSNKTDAETFEPSFVTKIMKRQFLKFSRREKALGNFSTNFTKEISTWQMKNPGSFVMTAKQNVPCVNICNELWIASWWNEVSHYFSDQ